MAAPFPFDRTWVFAVAPEKFFATVGRTDDFTRWWSWLRRCDTVGAAEGAGHGPAGGRAGGRSDESDGLGLGPGVRAECLIQAPLPYALHITVEIDELVTDRLIATHVTGDLHGPARLEIGAHPDGCTARLVWSLELRDPVLRRLAYLARPAMAWAHDRVVAIGVAEFERRALLSDSW